METVLITGASSGIGRELARCFAADGARLVLVARRRQQLQELADELSGRHGVECVVKAADLSQHDAARQMIRELESQSIEIDVLVNNAAFGQLAPVAKTEPELLREMVQVNVAAVVQLTRLLLPGMLQRRRGGVLNVGSTAAFQPGPRMAVYYASKAFVLSFTEALHEECAGRGLSVSCLCPGPTATEFAAGAGMKQTLLFRYGVMDAVRVARAGYRGYRRKRVVIVPGWRNRLGTFGVRLAPRVVVRKYVKFIQS